MGTLEYACKSGGDFYNLADPKVRKKLFERIGVGRNVEALELLWHCYFGNDWENNFNPEERRLMQTLVGEYAKKILCDGGEKAKAVIAMMLTHEEPPPIGVLDFFLQRLGNKHLRGDRETRKLMVKALLKFLPLHRDLFELDLPSAQINTATDAEDDSEIADNLKRLKMSVLLRIELAQSQSELE